MNERNKLTQAAVMTDHIAGELSPEKQFEMCEQGSHRTFDLLLKNGFDLNQVWHKFGTS